MKLSVREMVLASIFAALTATGAWIRIPLPYVSFTMQVFFVVFSGIMLGRKLGMVSQLIYLFIGLTGIPVFVNGGGPAYVLQPSFGYIIGFVAGAYVTGMVFEHFKNKNTPACFLSSAAGTITIYAFGVPYLYFINAVYLGRAFTFKMALIYGFAATIGGDTASIIFLSAAAPFILKAVKKVWVNN